MQSCRGARHLRGVAQAHAEDAGLKNGAASLAAGKYDAAVRQLSATINSDNAAPGDAAKALYLRGLAYRKMGESARAIADLGAAIWLGLPEPDKVKALVNRGLAYKAAGLSPRGRCRARRGPQGRRQRTVDALIAEGGGANAGRGRHRRLLDRSPPRGPGGGERKRRRRSCAVRNEAAAPPTRTANASPTAWSTSVSDGQQPQQREQRQPSHALVRLRDRLLIRTARPPPEPAPAPQAAAPPPKPAAPPPSAAAASSSWSTTTETQQAAATASSGESGSRWSRLFNRSAEAEPQAQPPPAPSASGGGFQLQLATSRSEGEAKALWKKVSAEQAVAGAQPQIEKVDIGNFGTFWSLRIGPFPDKAESLKVCNALKRSGIDCSPVTP